MHAQTENSMTETLVSTVKRLVRLAILVVLYAAFCASVLHGLTAEELVNNHKVNVWLTLIGFVQVVLSAIWMFMLVHHVRISKLDALTPTVAVWRKGQKSEHMWIATTVLGLSLGQVFLWLIVLLS